MHLVIDAQLVKGFFSESVHKLDVVGPDGLTGSPSVILSKLGTKHTCYLDDEGHIQHEWRSLVDGEWFDSWFADLLISGAAQKLPSPVNTQIETQLRNKGFPQTRDKRYVRVAAEVIRAKLSTKSYIVSEDLDFFDPKKKKSAKSVTRRKILAAATGPVRKVLKKHNILAVALCHECFG